MAAALGTLTDYNGVSEALGRRRVFVTMVDRMVRYVRLMSATLRGSGGAGAAGAVESVKMVSARKVCIAVGCTKSGPYRSS